MANLSIPSIRERLFNTSKHEQTTQRHSSNPFAQTSFKGNVLTADVFESSTPKVNNENKSGISFTGKLKASALVGSISDFGSRIQRGIESIKAFGSRVKNSVINSWNKLNDIEISLNPAKEKAVSMYNSMKHALTTPIELTSGISAKSMEKTTDMVAARALLADNVALVEASMAA